MDDAAGDLKQALPNVCDSVQIHVEVHQKSSSVAKKEDIRISVLKLLNRHNIVFGDYKWTEFDDAFLNNNVQSVSIVDTELKLKDRQPIDLSISSLSLHIFHLNEEGPSSENLEEENEDITAAHHWVLPAAEFHGLWESLIYDTEVKSNLLDYVMTALLFSDKNVDSNLISWNRVVLLHGPPGTGKTSLCKALAQKLTIRLSYRYRYGQLIEINSHSLFSKWFSESGKLVTKMFQKIQELVDDRDALVFVLIDEVESLTAARSAFKAGTEPSDAIRVVNAVLTQIDQIKRYPNVIILTTSNITEKIDMAFVDRADIKQYIGPPSTAAIFRIYLSCLEELMK
ncbi:PCH2 protein, partial [Chaetops frenatus]|nr:PCH2 protein [Chaetops frenatus]